MPDTVENLFTIRSQLVEELLVYLDKVTERAAQVPRYYPSIERGAAAFERIHQTAKVATDRHEFDRWRAEEAERLRRAGIPVEHAAYSRRPGRDKDEPERRRQEKAVRTVVWNDSTADSTEFRRCIMLGDPGFGKSWLLRHEAWRLARAAADHLRDRTLPLDEIVVPIHLRLSDLKSTRGPIQRAVLDLLGGPEGASGKNTKRTARFRAWLNDRLGTAKSVLLLDGWDEIGEEARTRLEDRLIEFSEENGDQRILLASRIVGYGTSPISGAKEVVLQSFGPREVEAFAGVWFTDKSKSSAFLGKLAASYSLGELARIPLMLSLMCRVGESEDKLPERRGELYGMCLRGLLRDWKQTKPKGRKKPVGDVTLKKILTRLQRAAEKLLLDGMEQFSEPAFAEAAGLDLESQTDEAQQFVDALKEDGILTPTNEARTEFLFLHRTFQEYLAGCSLASRPWEELKPLIDRLSWSPNWTEVLILLASELAENASRGGDPGPIMSLISCLADTETDDWFRHRLALATMCLGEASGLIGSAAVHCRPLFDEVARKSLKFQWEFMFDGVTEAIPHFRECWRALARAAIAGFPQGTNTADRLLGFLRQEDRWTRFCVVSVIGAIGLEAMRYPGVVSCLLETFLLEKESYVCSEIAEALRALGRPVCPIEYIPKLKDLLILSSDDSVRAHAAELLGCLGNVNSLVPFLMAALRGDPSQLVRVNAARSLGAFSREPSAFLEILPTLLKDLLDSSERSVRTGSTEALGAIEPIVDFPEVVPALMDCLREASDSVVRAEAAYALAKLGPAIANDVRLIPLLINRLRHDPDYWVRRATCWPLRELGSIAAGDQIVVPALVDAFLKEDPADDTDLSIRALGALSEMGQMAAQFPGLIAELINRLLDEGTWHEYRSEIAEALGKLGPYSTDRAEIVRALLHVLRTKMRREHEHVRWMAATALGDMRASELNSEAIPCLLQCLKRTRSNLLRSWVSRALGSLGEDAATHPGVLEELFRRFQKDRRYDADGVEGVTMALGDMEKVGVRLFLDRSPDRIVCLTFRNVKDLLSSGDGAVLAPFRAVIRRGAPRF